MRSHRTAKSFGRRSSSEPVASKCTSRGTEDIPRGRGRDRIGLTSYAAAFFQCPPGVLPGVTSLCEAVWLLVRDDFGGVVVMNTSGIKTLWPGPYTRFG